MDRRRSDESDSANGTDPPLKTSVLNVPEGTATRPTLYPHFLQAGRRVAEAATGTDALRPPAGAPQGAGHREGNPKPMEGLHRG
jgi:hypothetical protein